MTPADRLGAVMSATMDREAIVALGASLGFSSRVSLYVGRGVPVAAETYLFFCAAMGVDPMSGERHARRRLGPFQWQIFGAGTKTIRLLRKLSGRNAAVAIGIGPATLRRAEGGEEISTTSLLRICAWIRMHPYDFVRPDSVSRETRAFSTAY